MSRFVQSEERTQDTFLPCRLEDYVTGENPVRMIDVFVEELDLNKLGFAGMRPEATGRPAYHPSTMLKIAAVPPMPNARVRTAAAVNPLFFRSWRRAYRRSWMSVSRNGMPR